VLGVEVESERGRADVGGVPEYGYVLGGSVS